MFSVINISHSQRTSQCLYPPEARKRHISFAQVLWGKKTKTEKRKKQKAKINTYFGYTPLDVHEYSQGDMSSTTLDFFFFKVQTASCQSSLVDFITLVELCHQLQKD